MPRQNNDHPIFTELKTFWCSGSGLIPGNSNEKNGNTPVTVILMPVSLCKDWGTQRIDVFGPDHGYSRRAGCINDDRTQLSMKANAG
jgi:hypothetical protein